MPAENERLTASRSDTLSCGERTTGCRSLVSERTTSEGMYRHGQESSRYRTPLLDSGGGGAQFPIEHELDDDAEEIEFQFKWPVEPHSEVEPEGESVV